MRASLYLLSISKGHSSTNLGNDIWRQLLHATVRQGSTLTVSANDDLGVGASASSLVDETGQDGGVSGIATTREGVGKDRGAVIDALGGHARFAIVLLQRIGEEGADISLKTVSCIFWIESRQHTILPGSLVPLAKKKMMSLHPPSLNSFAVVPVSLLPRGEATTAPATTRRLRSCMMKFKRWISFDWRFSQQKFTKS